GEELLNTSEPPGPVGPGAAALSGRFIGGPTRSRQPKSSEKRHVIFVPCRTPESAGFTGPTPYKSHIAAAFWRFVERKKFADPKSFLGSREHFMARRALATPSAMSP
ncbi:hypothetical protein, partial [Tardiphaga sp.]|uniref:hypothetical protein n=1 Tax=Tardiphaga sp. TaxID=1926292 RepID=UPI0026053B5B